MKKIAERLGAVRCGKSCRKRRSKKAIVLHTAEMSVQDIYFTLEAESEEENS